MDKGVPGYFDGGREAGNFCHTGSLFPFALANLLTPSTALPPTMFFGAEEKRQVTNFPGFKIPFGSRAFLRVRCSW